MAIDGHVHLWSRQGTDLTDRSPDIRAALADRVAEDVVLDDEPVVWGGDRLDLDALQARATAKVAAGARLADGQPASYVAFDLPALDGQDRRCRPWHERRGQLEDLASRWSPPLQLFPATTELEEIWMTSYYPAGIGGVVAKAANGRYSPGQREWVKVRHRQTFEVIVGGVIGSLARPEAVVADCTTPLTDDQAQALVTTLTPAGANHPWPDVRWLWPCAVSRCPTWPTPGR